MNEPSASAGSSQVNERNAAASDQAAIDSQWSDKLSAYVDDELDAAERSALEAQLADSPALRAELAQLQTMMSALQGLREVDPPQGFAERVTKVATARRWLQETLVQSLASMPLQIVGVALVLIIAGAYFFLHGELARDLLDPPRP